MGGWCIAPIAHHVPAHPALPLVGKYLLVLQLLLRIVRDHHIVVLVLALLWI